MSGDGLANLILETIERWWAGRYTERHALVTSYDPKNYLAKVTFQPEGQESGWLPIETGHVGQGYGITIGLQPGSGSGFKGQQSGDGAGTNSGQGADGDQVVVRYQEGDIESGKIVQRVHSDQDKAPQAESGEIIIWAKFKKDSNAGPDAAGDGQGGDGQQISFKKDGSLTFTDGNGATIVMDGAGNIKHTCKKYTLKCDDFILDVGNTFTVIAGADIGMSAGNNMELISAQKTGIDAGSKVIVQGGGKVSDDSVTPPTGQPPIPPFSVPSS